jgi:hypothetical protein
MFSEISCMVMLVTSTVCTVHSVEMNIHNQPNKHWNLYISHAPLCTNSSARKAGFICWPVTSFSQLTFHNSNIITSENNIVRN